MRVLSIALLAACGRVGFGVAPGAGDSGGGGGSGDGAGGDGAPPGFCMATAPVVTSGAADLAIAKTSDGFLAIWGDGTGPARSLHADPTLMTFTAAQDVTALGAPFGVDAISEANVYLVTTTDASGAPSWWSLNLDLSQQSTASAVSGTACKDNLVTDGTRSSFVHVDATGTTIGMRYFFGNGFATTATNYTAAAPVVAMAGADGPVMGHGFAAWTTSTGSTDHVCYTGHVAFGGNPSMTNVVMQTATCGSQLRVAGGAAADDAAAIAFTDPQGGVHALYKTTAWDFGAGDGIRIKFDGSQFWTAWTGQGTGVHLGKLAMDGTFVDTPLPLHPVALEALEMVTSGSTVYVVSLEATQLVFIWPC